MICPILVQFPNERVKKIYLSRTWGVFLGKKMPRGGRDFDLPILHFLPAPMLPIFSFLAVDGVPGEAQPGLVVIGWRVEMIEVGGLSHSVIELESGPILRSETLSCSSFPSWGPALHCRTRRHPTSVSCWMELMFPTIKWPQKTPLFIPDMPQSDVSWAEEMWLRARVPECTLAYSWSI